jgi:hypothetical protein
LKAIGRAIQRTRVGASSISPQRHAVHARLPARERACGVLEGAPRAEALGWGLRREACLRRLGRATSPQFILAAMLLLLSIATLNRGE